jgi:hypothetical protein
MKPVCCWAAALLLLVLGGLGYKLLMVGETAPASDGRSAILLSPGERDLVLTEMRAFLQAVQAITQAVSEGDAVRAVGAAGAEEVPISLMAKLPLGFKELGLSTHRAFDQLALDAEQMGDIAQAQRQLATLLNNCVGCQAAFRIDPTP